MLDRINSLFPTGISSVSSNVSLKTRTAQRQAGPAKQARRSCIRSLFTLLLVCAGPVCIAAHAQAKPTASRSADIQVGVSFVHDSPDYTPQTWYGAGAYATIDFREHLGIELDYRQAGYTYSYAANIPQNPTPFSFSVNAYQRNYEIGPRYVRHYGRVHPYVKVLYGRAVQNFPEAVSAGTNGSYYNANLAYNMGVLGGGADVNVLRHMNVRVDYEYQHWFTFPSASQGGSLTPQILSIGAAYHF